MDPLDRYRLGQELARIESEEGWEPFLLAKCPHDAALRTRLLNRRRALVRTVDAQSEVSTLGTAPRYATGIVIAGRYEMLELKDVGGMGAVYRARDLLLGDIVAVKMVKLPTGIWEDHATRERRDRLIERFSREQKTQTKLSGGPVVGVRDLGRTPEGVPFFVMEWVDGQTLGTYIAERQPSLHERLVLFQRICGTVEFAHDRGIIHRDLKPGNVLVTAQGEPRLLDFGVAKDLDDRRPELTAADGGLLATPEYLSPEQVRGEPATAKSDQYALGIMLYQLLTGESPYSLTDVPLSKIASVVLDTDIEKASVRAQRNQQPPVPASSLRGDLDQIALCALGKEPDRRYDTVGDLRKDIERHLRHEPVLARPQTAWYRSARFVRRHNFAVAVVASVFLALAGLIIVQVLANRQLKSEQKQTLVEKDRAKAETKRADEQRSRADDERRRAEEARTQAEADKTRAEQEQARAELMLGGMVTTDAQGALYAGDADTALQLMRAAPTAVQTVVGQIVFSEAHRLVTSFDQSMDVIDTWEWPQVQGEFPRGYEEGIQFLTSVDNSRIVVGFDRHTQIGWFEDPYIKSPPPSILCMVDPDVMKCRHLFQIGRQAERGSIDPTGQFLSFVDERQCWIVGRDGTVVAQVPAIKEVHWLDVGRLVMIDDGSVGFYDLASKHLQPIPQLAGASTITVGRHGVLAAWNKSRVHLFDYRKGQLVGALEGAASSIAFSHSSTRFAVGTEDGTIQVYALDPESEPQKTESIGTIPKQSDKEPDSLAPVLPTWGVRHIKSRPIVTEQPDGDTTMYYDARVTWSRDDTMLLVDGTLVSSTTLRTLRYQLGGDVDSSTAFAPDSGGATPTAAALRRGRRSVLDHSYGSRLVLRTQAEHAAFMSGAQLVVLATFRGIRIARLDGSTLRTISPTKTDVHTDFALSPSTTDITVLQGHSLSRWPIDARAPRWRFDVPGPELGTTEPTRAGMGPDVPAVLGPVWSDDGRWIGIKSADTVFLIDAATGRVKGRANLSGAQSIRFTPDSRQLRLGKGTWGNGTVGHVFWEEIYIVPTMRHSEAVDNLEDIGDLTAGSGSVAELQRNTPGLRGYLDDFILLPGSSNGCLTVDAYDGYIDVQDTMTGRSIITLEGFAARPAIALLHPQSQFVLAVAAGEASLWRLGVVSGTSICRAGPVSQSTVPVAHVDVGR